MNTSKGPAPSHSGITTWHWTSALNNPVSCGQHLKTDLVWRGRDGGYFLITIFCRDHYFAFYFISYSPVWGDFRWGEGGRTNLFRCIFPDPSQFDNSPLATGSPMHAASPLSCATHLTVTLYTWTALKILAVWSDSKQVSLLALSGGEDSFLSQVLNKTSHY